MSIAYHRFNDNAQVQAFTCGIGAASADDPSGPLVWVVDAAVGERDGEPFFAAIVQTDDDVETGEDDIPVIDHRDHV